MLTLKSRIRLKASQRISYNGFEFPLEVVRSDRRKRSVSFEVRDERVTVRVPNGYPTNTYASSSSSVRHG